MAKVYGLHLHHPAGKNSQHILQHINSQDPHIEFTTKEPNQEGRLPFLDTLVSLVSATL